MPLIYELYIEMLKSLYFLFYNGFSNDAYRAIELIANKADEDLMVEVIVVGLHRVT
jgi:hypothetical protein